MGKGEVDHKLKYTFVCLGCITVHAFLFVAFILLKVYGMAAFNIFSVIGYIVCTHGLKKEKYEPAFFYTCIEITAHTILASVNVGWECGFAMYIIAFVPVTLYMQFNMEKTLEIRRTYMIGIYQAAAFVFCRIYAHFNEPFFKIDSSISTAFYVFNSLCTFIMLTLFSVMFMLEIRSSHISMILKNETLNRMASVDALTGLLNRRSMSAEFNRAIGSKENFSVIMCDIDDFKKINDTYGHDCGDIVLKEVASSINSCLRDKDKVSRWGGEEILILINNSEASAAALIAERIRKKIERSELIFEEKTIHCTITIGVADFSEGKTLEHTITIADERLYRGKTSGKNRVISEN